MNMIRSIKFSRSITEKMLNAFALHKIILDENGKPCDYEFIEVNPAFEAFTGLRAADISGKRYKETVPNSEYETTDWVAIYGRVAATGKPVSFESYASAFNKWVVVNAYSPAKDYFITIFSDITDIKRSEQNLREKNDELTSLYEELTASEEELRYNYEELLKEKEKSRLSEEKLQDSNKELEEKCHQLNAAQMELAKQNEELRVYQEKLRKMAYQDQLTGLPNRLALYEILDKDSEAAPDTGKALFFIDSDNFKFINDTLGHSFGDILIAEIAKRLLALCDTGKVFRLGGDEFIIYFNSYSSRDHLLENVQRIMQSFTVPFEIKESTIYNSVSIGISTYPDCGTNSEELMRNADIAMYQAKFSGKSKYVFYRQEMHENVSNRMTIEKHLRGALANNEFQIYYQPQYDIVAGKVTGFEALLRWKSPELGFVSPLNFIDIAEETHLILPIGEWVLRNSCFFLKLLHSRGNDDLTISVNISMLQLIQEGYVDSVLQLLEFINLKPQYLELEITETILMESYKVIHNKLLKLRQAGVKIALDDFGKGYSSLSYLKLLPINTLKIDKSFIDDINKEVESDNLTSAIIMIGRKLGLTLLAEGVEEKEQLDCLNEIGCHKIQGYLISRPLPQEEAIDFLARQN